MAPLLPVPTTSSVVTKDRWSTDVDGTCELGRQNWGVLLWTNGRVSENWPPRETTQHHLAILALFFRMWAHTTMGSIFPHPFALLVDTLPNATCYCCICSGTVSCIQSIGTSGEAILENDGQVFHVNCSYEILKWRLLFVHILIKCRWFYLTIFNWKEVVTFIRINKTWFATKTTFHRRMSDTAAAAVCSEIIIKTGIRMVLGERYIRDGEQWLHGLPFC